MPKLEFLWLEVTSNCNNRCLHCYAASGPDVQHCHMNHNRWLTVITEARQAGASAVQLIGGEPLLYPKWHELVTKAVDEGYEFIEIFTNGTLISEDDIHFFKQHNLHIATTLYSDKAPVHDAVTLNSGSFAATFDAIKKIVAADVPLRIASILMKPNENEAKSIMKLCAQLGVEVSLPDVVRPTGRGDDQHLLPDNYQKPPIRPPFYIDSTSFFEAHHLHCCLAGKIAIAANGDVLPCIFARNMCCGNIKDQSLHDILQDTPLQNVWKTTKDSIEKCRDCEYRYACGDCRPLAQSSDPAKRWLASSKECSYNPYTGEWPELQRGI